MCGAHVQFPAHGDFPTLREITAKSPRRPDVIEFVADAKALKQDPVELFDRFANS